MEHFFFVFFNVLLSSIKSWQMKQTPLLKLKEVSEHSRVENVNAIQN
jgi:hypothetical protein